MRRRILLPAAMGLAAVGVVLLVVLGTHGGSQSTRSTARTATRTAPTPKPPPPPRLRGPHDRPVPILMYHVIGPRPARALLPELYVSRIDFARELRWRASHHYHPVTLYDVYGYWYGRLALPRKPVVLTFDDGYRGDFTIADPLLKARGWPGVLDLEVAHVVHGARAAIWARRRRNPASPGGRAPSRSAASASTPATACAAWPGSSLARASGGRAGR